MRCTRCFLVGLLLGLAAAAIPAAPQAAWSICLAVLVGAGLLLASDGEVP